MPEEFDPTWEYRVTDPEIEWVMAHNSRGVTVLDLIRDDREFRAGTLRWGRGDPNAIRFHLAPERRLVNDRELLPRRCVTCIVLFHPKKGRQVCCSRRCAERSPKRAGFLHSRREVTCPICGETFLPKLRTSRYCSLKCGAYAGAPSTKVNLALLREMYERGDKLSDMAAALGVKLAQVKRLRRSLGLSARRLGRPKVTK